MSSTAESLLGEIERYCRVSRIAESTFGRQAVNDGKLCARLREGKDVTLDTAERIRTFIESHRPAGAPNGGLGVDTGPSADEGTVMNSTSAQKTTSKKKSAARKSTAATKADGAADRPFRFYDNRQKYLAFVNTTNEKRKVAERAARELAQLRPTPPALRLFDAGMGDGTVLSHVMRAMHRRFPIIPFFIVGKEISL